MLPPARLQALSVETWVPVEKDDGGGGPNVLVELNAGHLQKAASRVAENAAVEAWILGGVEVVH